MDWNKWFIDKMLYPAMSILKGNRIIQYRSELLKTQFFSYEELRALQEEKLRQLLSDCIENVPAYREYRYLSEDIQRNPVDALKRFPILKKKHFRAQSEEYFNSRFTRASAIENQTGGSTGEATRFLMDRVTVEHYEATRWRGLSWYGITPGSRNVMLWGNPVELSHEDQRKYERREKRLKNRILIPAYALDGSSVGSYVSLINEYRPEYLYGYSSALYALACLMREENLRLKFPLKAVVSTAETLHDFQREEIRKIFRSPVVNEYGARDGGIIAYECPEGGMHLNIENAFIEIIDPETGCEVPAGESGVLVITDLNNHIMPRLRYRLEDEAVFSAERCSCGRELPILERVCGREDEMLITPSGLLVHGHLLVRLSLAEPSVAKFQIVQDRIDHATLYVVLKEAESGEKAEHFIAEVRKRLEGVQVEVEYREELKPSKSGKFRYSIRTCSGWFEEAKNK